MQRGKPLSSYVAAALFILTALNTGCSANRAKDNQQRQISIDVEALLDVPSLRQSGTRNNCGPTAAAMVLGAYNSIEDKEKLQTLRNKIGAWSFDKFAMRRVKLPGVRGGMTPQSVLVDTLNQFSQDVTFDLLDPHQTYDRTSPSARAKEERALGLLKNAIADGKPVLAMVQSGILWPNSSESLHWVVVKGISDSQIVINDPADGTVDAFTVREFLNGWRLNPFFRTLPFIHSYSAIVGDAPLPKKMKKQPQNIADDQTSEPNATITAFASIASSPDKIVLK